MQTKQRDISAQNPKEALFSWLSPNHLEEATKKRPKIQDYSQILGTTVVHRGKGHSHDGHEPCSVSVIIPVRNSQDTLEQTINSIVSQNKSVEIVIVDGASTDKTCDVIRKHAEHVSLWISENDKSMYDAINKGIALSSGKILKILNADDCLTEDSIEIAQNFFSKKGLDGCLKSSMLLFDQDINEVVTTWGREHRSVTSPDFFPVLHPSWYVPRSLYQKHGLYLPYFKIAADQEYFLHLHRLGVTFNYVSDPLVSFRMGGMSSSLKGLYESLETNTVYLGRLQSFALGAETLLKKSRHMIFETVLGEERGQRVWTDLKNTVKNLSS